MKRHVPAIALGLTLCFVSVPSFSVGLEQKGQPDTLLSSMPNYGMEVPARTALKAVLPAGWQLFVHQSVQLPETLSWKLGDPWPKVLADLATRENLSVLLDWDNKTVLVRNDDVAVQEKATRAEIEQAAVTPLPRFDEPRKPKQPLVTAPVAAPSAPVAAPAVAVIRTNPTPAMVASAERTAREQPAVLASTREFSYTQAIALNRPPARRVAQAIANKYQLRLVWAAPEIQLQGPVTLLARSADEDTRLLQKALGAFSPVVFELSLQEHVLRVLPRELAGTRPVAVAVAPSVALPAAAPVLAPVFLESVAGIVEPAPVETRAPVRPVAEAPAVLTLELHAKEPLEDALLRFIRGQGFTLEWKVPGGFEANRDMTFHGATVAQVLSQLLPPLGVSADVYTRDKHIVIRPGERRDR